MSIFMLVIMAYHGCLPSINGSPTSPEVTERRPAAVAARRFETTWDVVVRSKSWEVRWEGRRVI